MLNVVIFNGGRGAASLIPALLAREGLNVTSVVNAYDDGKSTGAIRRFFGMLGPSDIRKVQQLMLPDDDIDRAAHLELFRYRFPAGCARSRALEEIEGFAKRKTSKIAGHDFSNKMIVNALRVFLERFLTGLELAERARGEQFDFSNCSLMNCVYAGAFLCFNRNIETATLYMDKLFKLKGTVLPTSIENKILVAQRSNGEMLYCEADIVELRSNVRIDRIYLLDQPLDPKAFESLDREAKERYLQQHHCFVSISGGVGLALRQADIIIYSAGTQHSSLYPTYMSVGLADGIAANKRALKVFITNIGADYETPSYVASDYLLGAYRYLLLSTSRQIGMPELFDAVLINDVDSAADENYVKYDHAAFDDLPVEKIVADFELAMSHGKHDGEKLARTILGLYESKSMKSLS